MHTFGDPEEEQRQNRQKKTPLVFGGLPEDQDHAVADGEQLPYGQTSTHSCQERPARRSEQASEQDQSSAIAVAVLQEIAQGSHQRHGDPHEQCWSEDELIEVASLDDEQALLRRHANEERRHDCHGSCPQTPPPQPIAGENAGNQYHAYCPRTERQVSEHPRKQTPDYCTPPLCLFLCLLCQ